MLNRLDPNLPDPVESRRRAAGRMVRFSYAAVVFGILGFFVVYFGSPLVYLSGPGVVSSPSVVVSLPYVVQVTQMHVTGGSTVEPGDQIAHVWSPQQHEVVASYMRAQADITGRSAELRIKARVARESLDDSRSYMRVTEEAVQQLESSGAASTAFRVGVFRERATARKNVTAQEAELAETEAQLGKLDDVGRRLLEQVNAAERNFADGRVTAPVGGIIARRPARVGESLAAGSPVAEILDPREVFVDWYVPNGRLLDPKVGVDVVIVHGTWRLRGTISEILPVSEVFGGARPSVGRDRAASQIARVRFNPGSDPPALNSTVYVHMYYSRAAAWVADQVIRLFGLERTAGGAP